VEAAIVRKDLKGFTRRRELLPYLALPVVFVALIVVQQTTTPGFRSGMPNTVYPIWLMGGIMTIIVAATSVGQEGKAILNIYASPVSPRVFLRAKLLVASLFGMATILAMLVVSSVLASASVAGFVASLLVSIVIVVECVFIGLGVATRHPDLQERPRPRFVQPAWLMLAILLGILLAFITAFPLVLWPSISGYLEGIGLSYDSAVGLGLAFGCVVCVIAYRWARSGAVKLLNELTV
jgi:predicted permease